MSLTERRHAIAVYVNARFTFTVKEFFLNMVQIMCHKN